MPTMGPQTQPDAQPRPAVQRKGDLNIVFTMDYPEILLVEDSMNPDTNALMFEVNNKEFS